MNKNIAQVKHFSAPIFFSLFSQLVTVTEYYCFIEKNSTIQTNVLFLFPVQYISPPEKNDDLNVYEMFGYTHIFL